MSHLLDAPVLVLNVNYEPINVCNTRRAFALLFSEKADLLMNGRGTIQTGAAEYELPSIIRLRHMVRRPRLHIALSKREIMRRDHFTCQYCGRSNTRLTIDHVVPRRLGGPHTWQNLVTACADCNRRKGGLPLERTDLTLRRLPHEPAATALYRFGRYLPAHNEWEPFLAGW